MCVWGGLEGTEVNLGYCFLETVHFFFFLSFFESRTVNGTRNSATHLGWLDNKPQASSCLCSLQHWDYKYVPSCLDFYMGLGTQSQLLTRIRQELRGWQGVWCWVHPCMPVTPAVGRLRQWDQGSQVQDHSELHCEPPTPNKTKKREQRTKRVREKELGEREGEEGREGERLDRRSYRNSIMWG